MQARPGPWRGQEKPRRASPSQGRRITFTEVRHGWVLSSKHRSWPWLGPRGPAWSATWSWRLCRLAEPLHASPSAKMLWPQEK